MGLRDERAKVQKIFGSRPKGNTPEGRIVPSAVPAPDSLPGLGTARYDGIAFTLYGRRMVASFIAYSKGTRTTRGVEIGDPLDKVRRRYRARCTEEGRVESGTIPAQCAKKLGSGTYIAFTAFPGSERIGSIAMSVEPFYGGCERGGSFSVPPREIKRCKREARTGRPAR